MRVVRQHARAEIVQCLQERPRFAVVRDESSPAGDVTWRPVREEHHEVREERRLPRPVHERVRAHDSHLAGEAKDFMRLALLVRREQLEPVRAQR